MQKPCQSMFNRINLLHTLGGTICGWHSLDSRQVYIGIVCSMLQYAAAAAWSPWLSATTTSSKHENVQLVAARAITALVHSTPVEVVLVESQLPPISTRFQTITQLLRFNQLGHNPQVLTPTSPSCEQLSIAHGISLPSSQQSPHQLTRECHHPSREIFRFKPLPPPPADFQIYTDGSVRDGIEDGGASLVVLSQVDHVHEWLLPGREGRPEKSHPMAILHFIMGLSYYHLQL